MINLIYDSFLSQSFKTSNPFSDNKFEVRLPPGPDPITITLKSFFHI